MKNRIKKIREYIEESLKRTDSDSILIFIELSEKEIKELSKFYTVKKDYFGYMGFYKNK